MVQQKRGNRPNIYTGVKLCVNKRGNSLDSHVDVSVLLYSRTTVTRTLRGNEKQFELTASVRVIGVN